MKLVKNSVQCLVCLEVLESKYQHDFVMCKCENQVFVDGGLSYIRMGAMNLDLVKELYEYEEDE